MYLLNKYIIDNIEIIVNVLNLKIGQRTNSKQDKCGHTCYFCGPGTTKTLVGEPPQTLVGTSSASFASGKSRFLTRSAAPPLPTEPAGTGLRRGP